MKHNEIIESLNFIRPNTKWKLVGEVLEWQDDEHIEPTQAEIQAGWTACQQAAAQAEAKAQAKRVAALAKLEALGLDEDDLKALGL